MTREEIKNKYNVDDNGIIRSPGKFEGEMVYAPFYHELILNGAGEKIYSDRLGRKLRMKVGEADREMFPELKDVKYVEFIETRAGFCVEV